MGAPLLAAAAFAKSRAGRRVGGGLLLALALLLGAGLVPLVGVPLLVASQAAAPADPGPVDQPQTVGNWGYPFAGGYSKGRGYGHHPVENCSYCPEDHFGYDMSQGCGADIFAAGPGTVILAAGYGQFGNAVIIDHGGGTQTLYAHMQWGSLVVTERQQVAAGTRLGAEGETGLSWGCHLHFEIRQDGARIDPQPFMANLGLPLP